MLQAGRHECVANEHCNRQNDRSRVAEKCSRNEDHECRRTKQAVFDEHFDRRHQVADFIRTPSFELQALSTRCARAKTDDPTWEIDKLPIHLKKWRDETTVCAATWLRELGGSAQHVLDDGIIG